MTDTPTLLLFVLACLVLLITPGPAVLYIVARSVEGGRAAGVTSALGLSVGSLVHIAAAALGLSALLVSSALAFSVVKYLGAAYLVAIGLRTLLKPPQAEVGVLSRKMLRGMRAGFVQGILVNLLNVKLALFVLAFLPQFVDPSGSVGPQVLILGVILTTLGLMTDSLFAVTAGTFGLWLKRRPGFLRLQKNLSGTAYIGLGVSAALTGSVKQ